MSRLKNVPKETSKENAEILTEFTARQRDVLKLFLQGKNEDEISQSLGITYHTVRSHICAIRNKLFAKSKLEMVNKCWNMGLVYEL